MDHLRNIYALLKDMNVPHVDSLSHTGDSLVVLSPRGIHDEPKTERELLQALICVLEALEVRRAQVVDFKNKILIRCRFFMVLQSQFSTETFVGLMSCDA
jgi:hypothetical protein